MFEAPTEYSMMWLSSWNSTEGINPNPLISIMVGFGRRTRTTIGVFMDPFETCRRLPPTPPRRSKNSTPHSTSDRGGVVENLNLEKLHPTPPQPFKYSTPHSTSDRGGVLHKLKSILKFWPAAQKYP